METDVEKFLTASVLLQQYDAEISLKLKRMNIKINMMAAAFKEVVENIPKNELESLKYTKEFREMLLDDIINFSIER